MVNEMTLVCKKCGRTYHLYPYQWEALKHKRLCGYCWDKQWTQRIRRLWYTLKDDLRKWL